MIIKRGDQILMSVPGRFRDGNYDSCAVDLRGTDFAGLDFSGVRFRGTTIEFAQWPDTDFIESSFDDAKILGGYYPDALFDYASFRGALLYCGEAESSSFRFADFTGATLSGMGLDDCDFTGACLCQVEFARDGMGGPTRLGGADFTGADLTGATFDGAEYDEQTRFPEGFGAAAHGLTLKARAPETRGLPVMAPPDRNPTNDVNDGAGQQPVLPPGSYIVTRYLLECGDSPVQGVRTVTALEEPAGTTAGEFGVYRPLVVSSRDVLPELSASDGERETVVDVAALLSAIDGAAPARSTEDWLSLAKQPGREYSGCFDSWPHDYVGILEEISEYLFRCAARGRRPDFPSYYESRGRYAELLRAAVTWEVGATAMWFRQPGLQGTEAGQLDHRRVCAAGLLTPLKMLILAMRITDDPGNGASCMEPGLYTLLARQPDGGWQAERNMHGRIVYYTDLSSVCSAAARCAEERGDALPVEGLPVWLVDAGRLRAFTIEDTWNWPTVCEPPPRAIVDVVDAFRILAASASIDLSRGDARVLAELRAHCAAGNGLYGFISRFELHWRRVKRALTRVVGELILIGTIANADSGNPEPTRPAG